MDAIILTAVTALLGVSLTVNGFFLRECYRELRELRTSSERHAIDLARHDGRLRALEHPALGV